MAKGGTYGDNMEISAFTSAFGIDVKIYQADFAYMIPAPDTGSTKQIAHIAYHVCGAGEVQLAKLPAYDSMLTFDRPLDLGTLFLDTECQWSAHRPSLRIRKGVVAR